MHVESLKKNSRQDPGLSYCGVNHLLTVGTAMNFHNIGTGIVRVNKNILFY